ncbi:CLOCK-interacting pacemaker a [Electrophorus electricus]|uniref:CLOCK-interacting pacemaker a n=1 Tax=Electrophorus electricus TaxID=8005 RepID=A0AAY5EAJ3_ELEEL|nr:CLOCK-interacting pacemaker a [Electrophorus electricus]
MANKQKVSGSGMDRDSGFSDCSSGYLSAVDQTEFEDMGSSTASTRSMQSAPQLPQVPGAYQGVSPMIVMNNIVLKQSNSETPAIKPWGFNSSLEVIPQSPVVLLQPVVPNGSRASQKYTNQKRQSRNYIPILNSFLKIAPHPAHGPREVGPSAFHRSNSGHSHGGKYRRHRHNDKQSRCLSLKQSIFETAIADSNSVDPHSYSHRVGSMDLENSLTKYPSFIEPSATASQFSVCTESYPSALPEESPKTTLDSSNDAEGSPVALSPSSSKHKRFCNTYNILNCSGLLGITLRTKELIRQNKRSQAQLQKLRAHTHLFLEAVSSGDPQVWARLQLALQNPSSEDPKEDMVGSALF